MPCPNSPEPDGFHRYPMAPQGTDLRAGYTTHCLHCGEEKHIGVPVAAPNVWQALPGRRASARYQASTAKGLAASRAARQAKREAP